MKTKLIFCFWMLALGARGQAADSAAVVREVDSLVQLNRKLVGMQRFGKRFAVVGVPANNGKKRKHIKSHNVL